jgi:hypothetical protein
MVKKIKIAFKKCLLDLKLAGQLSQFSQKSQNQFIQMDSG